MSFKNSDGTHPPALKEFEIAEDRHLRLNLTGVPACHGAGIQDGIPIQQACKGALIGTGRMTVNIQFPEQQEPIVTRSAINVYNGGVGNGAGHLLLAAYVTVPTPAAIVITMKVKHSDLTPYGLKLVGSVPKIAGGSGSVTYLAFRFHKGIFTATCPLDRNLDTHFTTTFVEGTTLGGTVVRDCTPAP